MPEPEDDILPAPHAVFPPPSGPPPLHATFPRKYAHHHRREGLDLERRHGLELPEIPPAHEIAVQRRPRMPPRPPNPHPADRYRHHLVLGAAPAPVHPPAANGPPAVFPAPPIAVGANIIAGDFPFVAHMNEDHRPANVRPRAPGPEIRDLYREREEREVLREHDHERLRAGLFRRLQENLHNRLPPQPQPQAPPQPEAGPAYRAASVSDDDEEDEEEGFLHFTQRHRHRRRGHGHTPRMAGRYDQRRRQQLEERANEDYIRTLPGPVLAEQARLYEQFAR